MNKPTPHAPGTGSDKQHPNTPADANERFRQPEEHPQPSNPSSNRDRHSPSK